MNIQWNSRWTTPAFVGVAFTAGVGVGYFICRKRYDETIDTALAVLSDISEDVESVTITTEEVTETVREIDFPPKLEDLRIIGVPHADAERGRQFAEAVSKTVEQPEPDRVVANVFDAAAWDQEAENEDRGPDAPYVISENEFADRERGFPQEVLIWYESDKKLATDEGMLVNNHNKVVGELPFGKGSRDPDVVHVRNERLGGEYEIHREYGSYEHAVLGLYAQAEADDNDLKHSATVRRFRPNRD